MAASIGVKTRSDYMIANPGLKTGVNQDKSNWFLTPKMNPECRAML